MTAFTPIPLAPDECLLTVAWQPDVLHERLVMHARNYDRITVFSLNLDQWVHLHRDPVLRRIYNRGHYILPDGFPIARALQWITGHPVQRVPGIDVALRLVGDPRIRRVFLLGSTPERVARAARRLYAQCPHLHTVAFHHGYFNDDANVITAVRRAGPEVMLIGMGFPKQETWIVRYRDMLPFGVAVCIGGGIDILAGVRRRAPSWMQTAGLEWVYRLVQEPLRLGYRYLIRDIPHMPCLIRAIRRFRKTRAHACRSGNGP